MIRNISEKNGKLEIDLTGPDGNAFVLLGTATNFAKQLGKDHKDITSRMMSGDYENLLNIFEEEFGEYVTLWR